MSVRSALEANPLYLPRLTPHRQSAELARENRNAHSADSRCHPRTICIYNPLILAFHIGREHQLFPEGDANVQSSYQRIEDLKRLAQDAHDNDQMASVVELLKCYLDYFPQDSKALFNYGDALRTLGRMGEAAVALASAEKLCPRDHAWRVQSTLGLLFHDCGDLVTAERWYARALENENARRESWLWVLRGANYAFQELLDEAESCHRNAISVNEKDDEAHLNLAMICRAKGKYEAAIEAATTALLLCPSYPEAEKVLKDAEDAVASRDLVERIRSMREI